MKACFISLYKYFQNQNNEWTSLYFILLVWLTKPCDIALWCVKFTCEVSRISRNCLVNMCSFSYAIRKFANILPIISSVIAIISLVCEGRFSVLSLKADWDLKGNIFIYQLLKATKQQNPPVSMEDWMSTPEWVPGYYLGRRFLEIVFWRILVVSIWTRTKICLTELANSECFRLGIFNFNFFFFIQYSNNCCISSFFLLKIALFNV